MRLHTIWAIDHVVISTNEHVHNYYQLMFCRSGFGAITVGENRYEVSAGDVYIATPMQKHSLVQTDGMHLVELKFVVEDRYLDENIRKLPPKFVINDDFLVGRIDTIVKEFYKGGFCSIEVVNYELFLLLVYMMRENLAPEDIPDFSTTQIVALTKGHSDIELERNFDRVIEYIEKHIASDLTLERLAEYVHFDKSYLTVKFKETWGLSPMRYVAHVRIERAKVLLATTDMSITDVARATGFSSIHYFSRHFKSKVGISPAEYRGISKSREERKVEFAITTPK